MIRHTDDKMQAEFVYFAAEAFRGCEWRTVDRTDDTVTLRHDTTHETTSVSWHSNGTLPARYQTRLVNIRNALRSLDALATTHRVTFQHNTPRGPHEQLCMSHSWRLVVDGIATDQSIRTDICYIWAHYPISDGRGFSSTDIKCFELISDQFESKFLAYLETLPIVQAKQEERALLRQLISYLPPVLQITDPAATTRDLLRAQCDRLATHVALAPDGDAASHITTHFTQLL